MNTRIKLLAEQAGINLPNDSEYNGHIYKNAVERFAGLIVRECVDWCNVHATVDGTAQKIAESIKKDFGVES
jgi:hypothetical protein